MMKIWKEVFSKIDLLNVAVNLIKHKAVSMSSKWTKILRFDSCEVVIQIGYCSINEVKYKGVYIL